MNDYVEVRLDLSPMPGSDATDLLAAVLGDVGFESFVPDESGLTAYIPVAAWNEAAFDEAVADFPFECEISRQVKVIEGRDWNEEWERNYFQPIVVGDLCVVHSSFHTDIPKAAYDIVRKTKKFNFYLEDQKVYICYGSYELGHGTSIDIFSVKGSY